MRSKQYIGIVDIEEAAPFGIVVAALEIVQPCGIVVVIPAIGKGTTERHNSSVQALQRFAVVRDSDLAPRVVAVFRQHIALMRDGGYDVPLQVAHKAHCRFVIYKAADRRVAFVIDEFCRERKLDDLFRTIERHMEIVRHALVGQKPILPHIVDIVFRFAVRFVLPLLRADAVCIVRELGIAAVCGRNLNQLLAVPREGLAVVGNGVTRAVILDPFAVIGAQHIVPPAEQALDAVHTRPVIAADALLRVAATATMSIGEKTISDVLSRKSAALYPSPILIGYSAAVFLLWNCPRSTLLEEKVNTFSKNRLSFLWKFVNRRCGFYGFSDKSTHFVLAW